MGTARMLVVLSIFLGYSPVEAMQVAPVSGFAISFLSGKPISGAKIIALENGHSVFTNVSGRFGPFFWPVGKPITLVLEKRGFHTTQTATIIVPRRGLISKNNNITFQVPSNEAYFLFKKIIGISEDKNSCHVATTIAASDKTLDDIPQGEEGAKMSLAPSTPTPIFYFNIFHHGPLAGKTNPFHQGLTATSLDGGLVIANLLPQKKPYLMTAVKSGVVFSQVKFICRPDVFINLSPPQSPMAQNGER